MNQLNVKFGDWIQGAFDIYKNNAALLISCSLIVIVLGAASLFLLAGPMIAGMTYVCLALVDRAQPKPEISDVFKGFNLFLPSFLLLLGLGVACFLGSLVLGWIPLGIGFIASTFLNYVLITITMFAMFEIVENRLDAVSAVKESYAIVQLNFWPLLGLAVVSALIGSIGAIVCGVGIIFTLPMNYCILAVAYRDIQGQLKGA